MGKINRKLTAAKMTLDLRKYHLDLTIKDTVERVDVMRKSEKQSKYIRMKLQYLKLCHKADKVKAKYGEIEYSKWRSKADMQTYLRPLSK